MRSKMSYMLNMSKNEPIININDMRIDLKSKLIDALVKDDVTCIKNILNMYYRVMYKLYKVKNEIDEICTSQKLDYKTREIKNKFNMKGSNLENERNLENEENELKSILFSYNKDDITWIENIIANDLNDIIGYESIKKSIIGKELEHIKHRKNKHELDMKESRINLYDENDNIYILSIKYNAINCVEYLTSLKNISNDERIIDINRRDILGRTALHFACDMNLKEIVMILYENGSNFNIRDVYGKYPIHLILNKSLHLKIHATKKIEDDEKYMINDKTLIKNNSSLVNKIEETNSSIVNIKNNKHDKTSFENYSEREIDLIELIKLCRIDINKKDGNGLTLLHYCVKENKLEEMKHIIKTYELDENRNSTLLEKETYKENEDENNIKHSNMKLKFNIKNNKGETAFLSMVINNRIEMIDYVLDERIKKIMNSNDMDYEFINKEWFNIYETNDAKENMIELSIKYGIEINAINIKNNKIDKSIEMIMNYYKRVKKLIYETNRNEHYKKRMFNENGNERKFDIKGLMKYKKNNSLMNIKIIKSINNIYKNLSYKLNLTPRVLINERVEYKNISKDKTKMNTSRNVIKINDREYGEKTLIKTNQKNTCIENKLCFEEIKIKNKCYKLRKEIFCIEELIMKQNKTNKLTIFENIINRNERNIRDIRMSKSKSKIDDMLKYNFKCIRTNFGYNSEEYSINELACEINELRIIKEIIDIIFERIGNVYIRNRVEYDINENSLIKKHKIKDEKNIETKHIKEMVMIIKEIERIIKHYIQMNKLIIVKYMRKKLERYKLSKPFNMNISQYIYKESMTRFKKNNNMSKILENKTKVMREMNDNIDNKYNEAMENKMQSKIKEYNRYKESIEEIKKIKEDIKNKYVKLENNKTNIKQIWFSAIYSNSEIKINKYLNQMKQMNPLNENELKKNDKMLRIFKLKSDKEIKELEIEETNILKEIERIELILSHVINQMSKNGKYCLIMDKNSKERFKKEFNMFRSRIIIELCEIIKCKCYNQNIKNGKECKICSMILMKEYETKNGYKYNIVEIEMNKIVELLVNENKMD